MNTTRLIIALVCVLVSGSLSAQNPSGFTIKGSIANGYEGYLYLSQEKYTDSVLVEENQFEFSGSVAYPTEARFHVKGGPSAGGIYLENRSMQVTLSVRDNVTFVESIEGNNTQRILQELTAFYEENEENENLIPMLYQRLETIIQNDPKSQFSGELLSDVITDPIFSFEEANSLVTKLDSTTQTQYAMNSIKESLDKLKNMKIGTAFPGLSLPDQQGKSVSTSDYSGKILLVEFWASWCAPCRKTNPELVAIHKEFANSGFDILGVSLDKDREDWIRAMEKDGLTWENTLAKEGFDNPMIKQLKIQYVPSNYLIDKEGNILGINLKPKALRKKLNELLE